MKQSFNNYDYIGSGKDLDKIGGSFQFDPGHFNDLIINKRYNEAADYASNYVVHDSKQQQRLQNAIYTLRRNAKIVNSVYNNITDQRTKQQVSFYDDVFTSGGLESDDTNDNPFVKQFINYKNKIGSNGEDVPDVIELNIAPREQRLFGSDNPDTWIGKLVSWVGDRLIPDNKNDIDKFYEKLGVDKNTLENNGVKVEEHNGTTSIIFNASNDLANKIIYAGDSFEGGAMDGNLENPLSHLADVSNQFIGYKLKNGKLEQVGKTYANGNIRKMIDDAKAAHDKAFNVDEDGKMFYSSTVSTKPLFDGNPELTEALLNGDIKESTFDKLYKETPAGRGIDVIKGAGLINYDMYGTEGFFKNGDEADSQRLIELDQSERSKLISRINMADPSDITLNAMISNGRVGTLITVRTADKDQGSEVIPKKINGDKNQSFKVFVPGLFSEEAQKSLDSDSSTRAITEVNSMIDYGYDYDTSDGKISVKKIVNPYTNETTPQFMLNNNPITQDEASKYINKDMILNDAKVLKLNYINNEGKMTNFSNFDNTARTLALNAGNELFPDVPLTQMDGTPFKDEDIFNYKTIETLKGKAKVLDNISNSGEEQLNEAQYVKVSQIMDIYNKIMEDASPYYIKTE